MANKQISGRRAEQWAAPALSTGRESRIGKLTRNALHCLERYRPDRFTLFLTTLAVLSAALVLLRGANYGVGLQVDSASYISTARSLLEGKGFVEWNTGGYENAAPLFPLALAFAGLFGPDAVEAAGYVNAAAFGLTVFATAMWLRSRVRSRFLVVWAGCVCALAPPLTYFAAEAMTEALFILFVTLSLFALDRFLESGKPAPFYLGASCAALAWAARYPGIALVAAAVLLLLLRRSAAWPARARNAAVFAGIAAAPVCVWTLRNFLPYGALAGRHYPTGFTLLGSLQKATVEFVKWPLGESGFFYLQKWSAAALGIEIIGATTAGVLLKIAILLALAAATGLAVRPLRRQGYLPTWRIIAVPAVFAAVYTLFLAVILPLSDIQLPRRYLAPLYVPALVAAAVVLNEFLRCAAEKGGATIWRRLPTLWRKGNKGWAAAAARRAPAFLLKACLCLWLAQQVPANYRDIRHRIENGSGYASRQWDDSEIVRYMKARPRGGCIWSNKTRALYLLADPRPEYRDLPPSRLPYYADRQKVWYGEDCADTWFVWFYKQHHLRYDYGLKEVAALPVLEIEAVLEDGVIFKVNKGKDAVVVGKAAQGEALKKAVRPVIRGAFDAYHDENANKPIYIKEGCRGDDLAPKFFLKAAPVSKADLPRRRRRRAFDEYGFEAAGPCAAVRGLPDYAAAEIQTGQWLPREDRKIWEGEFRPD